MKLTQLLERLEYEVVQGDDQIEVTELINDSRKVTEGSVFVCISGAVSDGHAYVQQVAEKGAAAVIVEKDVEAPEGLTVIKVENTRYALALTSAAYFGYPAEKLKVIGITGTKGKTTTTYMVKSILEEVGIKVGLIGTIEAIIGDKSIPANNTTPESYTIQKYFSEMVEEGCECVVMEVSSQGLKLDRTAGIPFEIGIFTNLGEDHIGPNEHKDFNEYKYCKSLLFKQCKIGIGNVDDKWFEDIFKDATCKVETFGFSEKADIRATDVKHISRPGYLGVQYHVAGLMDFDVEIDIPGDFSVYNSLTAIAVCRHFGVPKKSWEGFAGGVLCAVAVGWLYGLYAGPGDTAHGLLWSGAGLVVAVAGVLGDLVESMLKRSAGLKDSGNSIPGHGGFLDRFDALILAVPFVYAYFAIFAYICVLSGGPVGAVAG